MAKTLTPFDAVKRVMSQDPHRASLCTVVRHDVKQAKETVIKDGSYLIATDTHRLAMYREGDSKLAEPGEVQTTLIPTGEGNYPNWQRVVPEVSESYECEFSAGMFSSALASLVPVGKESAYRCILEFPDTTHDAQELAESDNVVYVRISVQTTGETPYIESGMAISTASPYDPSESNAERLTRQAAENEERQRRKEESERLNPNTTLRVFAKVPARMKQGLSGRSIAFNVKYLQECTTPDARTIVCRFVAPGAERYDSFGTRPAIFEVSGGSCDGLRTVVMPMQLS